MFKSKISFHYYYEFLGPIFESAGGGRYNQDQDSNLRLNVRQAKFVEALISDSFSSGFKNSDNVKLGHRNIYINGGEKHPYCEPLMFTHKGRSLTDSCNAVHCSLPI